MEFKIDTRSNHVLIQPQSEVLSVIVTETLMQRCSTLSAEGHQNFLIDMTNCQHVDEEAIDALSALHEQCYGQDQSLVFSGLSDSAFADMNSGGLTDLLNIAPTTAEAVDIISMEVMERDLFKEG